MIAIIIPNLAVGGAERWVANVSRLLCERGHKVEVFIFENKVEQELAAQVRLTILDPSRSISGSFLSRIRYARKLRRIIASKGRFDLIISTLPYADQIIHMAGFESVYCRIANTLSQEIARLDTSKASRRIRRYRKVYGNKKLIAVSAGVKDDLINFLGIEEDRIQIIRNPIKRDFLKRQARENSPGMPDEAFIIHSGRFTAQKRHDILLDAWALFKKNSPINLLVLLTTDNEKLRDMIRKRGLEESVLIAGFHNNPYPWVSRARCLVLSSEREGMPNVLLEALTLDTPVASTDCPSGPKELLGRHHPQALAILNDAASLAKAIDYAINANFSDMDEILAPFTPAAVIDSILNLCDA